VGLAIDLALIPSMGPLGAALAVVAAEWSLAIVSFAAVRGTLSPAKIAKSALNPGVSALIMAGAVVPLALPLLVRVSLGAAVYVGVFLALWNLATPARRARELGGWGHRTPAPTD
jgi:hypothetical protein